MDTLPPFLTRGENNASFYSLAYCLGFYGRGTPSPRACLSLDYCLSPDFCRFSFQVCAPDGQMYHYHRGDDNFDSTEFALIFASVVYRTPANDWRLFPLSDSATAAWAARPDDRAPYLSARAHLARILWRLRAHNQFPAKPLFLLDTSVPPPGLFNAPDSEEISSAEEEAILAESRTNEENA